MQLHGRAVWESRGQVNRHESERSSADVEFEVKRGPFSSRIAHDLTDREFRDPPGGEPGDDGERAVARAPTPTDDVWPRIDPFASEDELVELAQLGGRRHDRVGTLVGPMGFGDHDDVGPEGVQYPGQVVGLTREATASVDAGVGIEGDEREVGQRTRRVARTGR
jgi:hypothetical protein